MSHDADMRPPVAALVCAAGGFDALTMCSHTCHRICSARSRPAAPAAVPARPARRTSPVPPVRDLRDGDPLLNRAHRAARQTRHLLEFQLRCATGP